MIYGALLQTASTCFARMFTYQILIAFPLYTAVMIIPYSSLNQKLTKMVQQMLS
jgi:hypothetical protein